GCHSTTDTIIRIPNSTIKVQAFNQWLVGYQGNQCLHKRLLHPQLTFGCPHIYDVILLDKWWNTPQAFKIQWYSWVSIGALIQFLLTIFTTYYQCHRSSPGTKNLTAYFTTDNVHVIFYFPY